jgi:hypothetical protein
MFLSLEQIRKSIEHLEDIQPFLSILFLMFKKSKIPIYNSQAYLYNPQVSFESETDKFLEKYYKPNKKSEYCYVCTRKFDGYNKWAMSGYIVGSISTYIHISVNNNVIFEPTNDLWGWKDNYIEEIKQSLDNFIPISIFYLAVWLYRDQEWTSDTTAESIIKCFIEDFSLNEQEIQAFFNISVPDDIDENQLFQPKAVSWQELKTIIGRPPDIPPDEGSLTYLEIQNIGLAKNLCFQPGNRLNLITGDNGLGKTFLLECSWWALTGQWAGLPAYPMKNIDNEESKIIFHIGVDFDFQKESISYNWELQKWDKIKNRPTIPGLLIYARVDGSFAVWDTAKQYLSFKPDIGYIEREIYPFSFTKEEIWQGQKDKNGNTLINGLLQDWVQWQSRPDKYPFHTLVKVLERLSPPEEGDLGVLKPGEPVRLPYDAREIPTIEHPYGTVPIIYASAGVQRIITLAYLIVWAWEEHKIQSKLIRREPQKRMVILVDELEAHLHPQWQRRILPALLDVSDDLAADLQVQIMVATHSPLVMASVEPRFDERIDKLFKLDLVKNDLSGKEVQIEELPFIRQGVVDSWLMSDVFGLRHSRSLEAEKAIEKAKALQLSDNPEPEEVAKVSQDLARYLSEDDEFWPRWVYFAEQHGVDL